MGLLPLRHLLRYFSGYPCPPGPPPTTSKNHSLPHTSHAKHPLRTSWSIPLAVLSTGTAILFILTCWLATAGKYNSLYPDTVHRFRGGIDENDSLGILVRSREQAIYDEQVPLFDLHGTGGLLTDDKDREVIRPEYTTQETKESESRGKSRLWFKAEYVVEIPLCEGESSGGGCMHRNGIKDGSGNVNPGDRSWIPAVESVRVSFCTGSAVTAETSGENGNGNGNGNGFGEGEQKTENEWAEEKSWDYVFPPPTASKEGPSGIQTTAGEWIFGIEKRPLERWRSVDVPGRAHDTALRTHMTVGPTRGGRPQWQFYLTTAGVFINADAWNVFDEEVLVEVPVERKRKPIKSLLSRLLVDEEHSDKPEVEKVLMWRWKGRYGGCPGEVDGRGVVLEVTGEEEVGDWVRDDAGDDVVDGAEGHDA